MGHEKLSPRQKMIGMMYLVLTAMLALNVSKEAVEAFKKVDKGLTLTVSNYIKKNNLIYSEFDRAAAENPAKAGKYRTAAYEVKERADEIGAIYRTAGFPIWCGSFREPGDAEGLLAILKGRTVAFAGQSGVGKSTLLNVLLGSVRMPTGAISGRIGRGRHTTRHAELFPLPDGGFLADTPGFSQLEITEAGVDAQGLLAGYPEFAAVEGTCRFTGCRHVGELGCAVDPLVAAGAVDPGRLERYRGFRRQVDLVKHYDHPNPSPGHRSRR